MTSNLQNEYEAFLRSKKVEPFIPPSDDEIRQILAQVFANAQKDAMANPLDPYRDYYLSMTPEQVQHSIEEMLPAHRNIQQTALDGLTADLISVIAKREEFSHFDPNLFYVSTFPSNLIDAFITPSKSGFLVLLDTGTITFITQFTQIYFSMFNNMGFESLTTNARIVMELILCYLTHTEVAEIRDRMPRTVGMTAIMQKEYNDFCQKFIIAHEFGHALLGHFGNQPMREIYTRQGDLPVLNTSWQQEYEADRMGLYLIILNSIEEEQNDPQGKRGNIALAIAGAMLFFAIEDMIIEVNAFVRNISSKAFLCQTHPPAAERIRNLENFIQEMGLQQHTNLGTGLVKFCRLLLQNGLAIIKEETHTFDLLLR